MNSHPLLSRRHFVQTTGLAALAAGSLTPHAWGANDKIRIGLVGCGGQGSGVMKGFLNDPDAEVIAVCDVDSDHMDKAAAAVEEKSGRAPKKYRDFRDLLANPDIDAVIVGTPDHWHALVTVAACEAGKDVYVEKPLAHNIYECKAMVAAARRFKRVIQVGTQQRSSQHFQNAIDYVRAGKLGDVQVCRAWHCRNGGDMTVTPVSEPPASLDYNFWLGPAPKSPYQENHVHFNWRWFFEYGGGYTTDWGVHMIDIALLGMNMPMPRQVSAEGGLFYCKDDRNTPDTMVATVKFDDFLLTWESRYGNARGLDGGNGHGSEFIGDKGTLICDRGKDILLFPENKVELEPVAMVNELKTSHRRDFLDCIKTREKTRSDVESMAKTTIICNLINIACMTGETVRWNNEDPDLLKQDIVGGHKAKQCPVYKRKYRRPWKLVMHKA